MRLTKVRITEFQSIHDSTEFDIDDITCLVGKNEAGKTAILKALYRLNPVNDTDANFNYVEDYPRQTVSDYDEDVKNGKRSHATVVQATYALEDADISLVSEKYGPDCLKNEHPILTLEKGYSNERVYSDLEVDIEKTLQHLVHAANLPADTASKLSEKNNIQDMLQILNDFDGDEMGNNVETFIAKLQSISDDGLAHLISNEILYNRIPKFLYFDEYYQIKGQDNLNALIQRHSNNTLEDWDYPLLGLIDLANIELNDLINPQRTISLFSRLEAATNRLTSRVLPYWSQNKHIRMKIDVRPGNPEDPPGMTNGMNIWWLIEDTRHFVSTELGTRSRGFVWFFSFLAWYSKLRKENDNLILLLDEPGLSLHARAQADLLCYFETELKPEHQLIYTTHSPFMVDPSRFDRVRIVQDLSIEPNSEELPDEEQGTKVTDDVLKATQDSLFPLQSALGYDISQTLFIGPNCLVVEGVSDMLYIQTISSILQGIGKNGLSNDWTITPVGGLRRLSSFVALIRSQKGINLSVLIDNHRKDQQTIANLYREKLLRKNQIFTYSDLIQRAEADVEDLFEPEFYLKLVNEEYHISITLDDLASGPHRILSRIENYLDENPLPNKEKFIHYRPARYFAENIGKLGECLTDSQLDNFQRIFDVLNDLLK